MRIMNTYSTEFYSTCPVNGVRVLYQLTVQTSKTIKVEDLISTVSGIHQGMLHEDIAQYLLEGFGGEQTLQAYHHGVVIKTVRP